MSDQCKHCVVRGDYNSCIKQDCWHHKGWINKTRIGRIKELEVALQEIIDLPSVREDEGWRIASDALNQLPPEVV